MIQKKIFFILIVLATMFSFVSSAQLEVVKVENLREGDIIVDKYGNEIVVGEIKTLPSESLTISEYLKQKVNLKSIESGVNRMEKMVVGGNFGPGSITGNAVVSGIIEKENPGFLTRMLNKIKRWFRDDK